MEHAPKIFEREDKLKDCLKSITKDFLFDELSVSYIEEKGLDFLKGIAVPFRTSDLVALNEKGIDPSSLVDNMAMVIGADVNFPYVAQYMKFMAVFFNERLIDVFNSNGANSLVDGDFRTALAYYRMALVLDEKNLMALFGYACCCREFYLSMEGEDGVAELIEILKSESTAYYEWTIIEHPNFAPSYYYLGFAYLNAALYSKAQFIWQRFIDLSEDKTKQEVQEIKDRILELEDPVKIEEGINKLTTGDLESGLKILEPYTESRYKDWWPLHYYLACTYRELEHPAEAIEGFKRVLALNPSNIDACIALGEIYEEIGDAENAKKYSGKAEIIKNNKEN